MVNGLVNKGKRTLASELITLDFQVKAKVNENKKSPYRLPTLCIGW